MLREEMIYHEKKQLRAKAGFHVSIESLTDINRDVWRHDVWCVWNVSIGIVWSLDLIHQQNVGCEVSVDWKEEDDVTCASCNARHSSSPKHWGVSPKKCKDDWYRGAQNQL